MVTEKVTKILSTYGGLSLQKEAEQVLRCITSRKEDGQGIGLNIYLVGAVTRSDGRNWAKGKSGS